MNRRELFVDVKEKKKISTLQAAGFSERRAALRRKLHGWRQLQDIYMPSLRCTLQDPSVLDISPDILPKSIPLFMPSELESNMRSQACVAGLVDMECRLRRADTSDALEELRRQLRTRTALNRWKVNNITGQRPNTRARNILHSNDLRIHIAKMRYRKSRGCVFALIGPGDWEKTLRPLRDEDVRGLPEKAVLAHEQEEIDRLQTGMESARAMVTQIGEGHRVLSWIWYSVSAEEDEDSPGMHEGTLFFF
jgi:hypothetical protein